MKKIFVVCLLFATLAIAGCVNKNNENDSMSGKKNTSRDEEMIYLDLKMTRYALERYHGENGKYPVKLSPGEIISSGSNWAMPLGTKGETSNCETNYEYKYSSVSDDSYSLTYCLDGNTKTSKEQNLSPGIHTATQDGLW